MPNSDRLFQYLLELNDESFFSLYRNYRGPIHTPYNKHDLITELRDFLARPDTLERIAQVLDATDRIVLSAVDLLNSPDEASLQRFLDGELEPSALRTRILNLQDRLLLIEGPAPRSLQLNPVAADRLRAAGLGAHTLVAGTEIPARDRMEAAGPPWLTIPFVTALYSFLRDTGDLFTRTGSIRKRASNGLEAQFGTLLLEEAGAVRLRTAVGVLETAGLARREGERVLLRPESWEELGSLPDRWIQTLLWGAALTSSVERMFEYAELLLEFIEAVTPAREFTLGELVRLIQLTGNGMTLPIDRDTVFRLVDIGVLVARDVENDPQSPRFHLNPSVPTLISGDYAGSGEIRVQANMEISLPPGVSYAHALTVAQIGELIRYDVVPSFRLSDASIAAARRDGLDRPFEQLQEIAGELPQNVRFLIQRWQERAGAVRLLRGLLLIAGAEEAAILQGSPEFGELLREEVAPGVFLLKDESRRVERLLGKLELGTATMVEGQRPVDVDVPDYARLYQRYQQPAIRSSRGVPSVAESSADAGAQAAGDGGAAEVGGAVGDDLIGSLKEQLHRQDLPEDIRQELELRIERKLILFPEQIRGDVIPQYGTEARGLDYLGKIRLIEQAIANGDLLEIITRSAAGSPQRVMVQPREVVERGSDLMLRARQEPDHQAIRIRIRRISLVRRLSGTLLRRSGSS
ncbi:MAG: hypothetical protein ACOCU4_00590 [Alkalispirochaeta sp.]